MKLGTWIVTGFGAVLVVPLVVILVMVASEARSEKGVPRTVSSSTAPGGPADFVYASADNAAAYRLAREQGDLFAQMPCFCGCANLRQDAHQSLLDCFVNEDGSLDTHASGCTVCEEIALDTARWHGEGASVVEVRNLIEAKYADRGPATNTPPVSG